MEFTIIQKIAIWILPVLFAISLHEVAHGWVASWFGDQTARLSGRLSLNPVKHIDPIGTIFMPLVTLVLGNFIFGWAKPVPIDARNMKHPRRDMAIVALAGPLSNLIMALLWAFFAKLGWYMVTLENEWFGLPIIYMGNAGIMINVVLCILNLIPLPPLDGGTILLNVLPKRMAYHASQIEPYSFLILILMMFSGVLYFIMMPPISFLMEHIQLLFGLNYIR